MNIVYRWIVVVFSVTICILTFLVGQPLVYMTVSILDSLATGLGFAGTTWNYIKGLLVQAANYGLLAVALGFIAWGIISSLRREALGYEYG